MDIFNEDFKDFIKALNSAQVEYVLVGGYSVILHGYARTTGDMDIFGREPNRIDIMIQVKGLDFKDAFLKSKTYTIEKVKIRTVSLVDLIQSKKAAGRFKDLDDIEQLTRK